MSNPFEDLRQAVVVRPMNSPGPQGPQGAPAPEVKIQYSSDGQSSWHDEPVETDRYIRFSTDGGRSWGDAVLFNNLYGYVIGPDSSIDGGIAIFDGTTGKLLKDSGLRPNGYDVLPIGVPIPVWDHLTIDQPPNSGNGAIYIRLTAGQSGPGGYNQGLLRNETVSGSAPLVTATAVINLSDSPIYNQTVHLINTEEAFIRARTVSGELQNDQMQQLTGYFNGPIDVVVATSGVFYNEYLASLDYGGTGNARQRIFFDSSRQARSGSETRSKNVSATWYLRIR